MDTGLSEKHRVVRRSVRRFCEGELKPIAKEIDQEARFPWEVVEKMGRLGYFGIQVPRALGGADLDSMSYAIVIEEISRVCAGLGLCVTVHNSVAVYPIMAFGSKEQKQKWVPPLARGEKIGCGAFTEPGAGTDFAHIQSTGKKDGQDYILNGEKMWVSLATVADFAIVTVRTDQKIDQAYRGLSTFLVDLESPGITRGDIHGKLGVRAGSTGWINFQDVRVPAKNLLGEEGEGFKVTMSAFDSGRYTVAAGATGLIRAALEASKSYAEERNAFGGKISDFQLIQAKIARMALDYQAARLLYLNAGWLKNQGTRNTRETSAAKWYATEASFRAASEAVQIHGAYGFSDEYPVERFMRNAKGAMIYEGSNEIQSLIQADYALGKRRDKKIRRELPPYDHQTWTFDPG